MTNKLDPGSNGHSEQWEEGFWGAETTASASELREVAQSKRVYDLEERTALFGEAVIRFAKKIPPNAAMIGLLVNWLARPQVLAQITAKLMTLFPRKSSSARSAPAKRKRVKRNSFSEWWPLPNPI
jgi:hypothetical protein